MCDIKENAVQIIEKGSVIKCWRMKGMKEFMPSFAEGMMEAAERFIKTVDEPNMVNAELYKDNENNIWVIDMYIDGYKELKGTLRLSEHSTNKRPDATWLHAGKDGFGLNFGDVGNCISYEDCFCMLYSATITVASIQQISLIARKNLDKV